MLTARSILIAAIAVAILATAAALVSFFQPPDQHGLGQDSYGTRAHGYRGIYDTLHELGFDVVRSLGPPEGEAGAKTTLVLWAPDNALVEIEPVYLQRLRQWIRDGGRLIVAPEAKRDRDDSVIHSRGMGLAKSTTVFKEIGLPEIETTTVNLPEVGGQIGNSSPAPLNRDVQGSTNYIAADIDRYLFPTLFPIQTSSVRSTGKLAQLCNGVAHLELPSKVQVLKFELSVPDGIIYAPLGPKQNSPTAPDFVDASRSGGAQNMDHRPRRFSQEIVNLREEPAVLAALFKLGAGEVLAVSDPAVLDNRLFSQADNAVLAVELLGRPQQAIVWDEFYHGLTVRGNPLYLPTRSYYGLLAATIVMLTAAWVWRRSLYLGPALVNAAVKRRSIAEYVEATANFFHRGSDSLIFMLAELRRGVLWSLRNQFAANVDYDSPEPIAEAIARRDPARALKLLDAVREVDLMLSGTARPKRREILQAAQGLIHCL